MNQSKQITAREVDDAEYYKRLQDERIAAAMARVALIAEIGTSSLGVIFIKAHDKAKLSGQIMQLLWAVEGLLRKLVPTLNTEYRGSDSAWWANEIAINYLENKVIKPYLAMTQEDRREAADDFLENIINIRKKLVSIQQMINKQKKDAYKVQSDFIKIRFNEDELSDIEIDEAPAVIEGITAGFILSPTTNTREASQQNPQIQPEITGPKYLHPHLLAATVDKIVFCPNLDPWDEMRFNRTYDRVTYSLSKKERSFMVKEMIKHSRDYGRILGIYNSDRWLPLDWSYSISLDGIKFALVYTKCFLGDDWDTGWRDCLMLECAQQHMNTSSGGGTSYINIVGQKYHVKVIAALRDHGVTFKDEYYAELAADTATVCNYSIAPGRTVPYFCRS